MSDEMPALTLVAMLYGANNLDCKAAPVSIQPPDADEPIPLPRTVPIEGTCATSGWVLMRVVAFLKIHHGRRLMIEFTEPIDDITARVHYRLRKVG